MASTSGAGAGNVPQPHMRIDNNKGRGGAMRRTLMRILADRRRETRVPKLVARDTAASAAAALQPGELAEQSEWVTDGAE